MFDNYGLKFNPFELKNVSDMSDFKKQPFLLLRTQKILRTSIETNIMSEQNNPLYYVILGERGVGKTSTLFFLKEYIDEIPDLTIMTRFVNNPWQISSYPALEKTIITDDFRPDTSSKKRLTRWLENKKVFLFIDVVENATKDDLKALADGLQILLEFKQIRVVLSMNIIHYDRMFDITEILGKYMVWRIQPFSLEETKELIYSRLNFARIDERDDFYPFTDDAINKIYMVTKGIPRNILSACDMCLMHAVTNNIGLITEREVSNILKENYAEKVLAERVFNESKRKALLLLYNTIKNDFSGVIKKEGNLVKYMHDKYGWSLVTTRNRLRMLQRLGLVEIRKSAKDMWTNIIRTV